MSMSAPPGEPSISETLTSSFRDAAAVVKTNAIPAGIFIVLGTIAAIIIGSAPPPSAGAPANLRGIFVAGFWMLYIMGGAINFFAIAASVRTVNAEYKMTAGQFFGIVGYGLLATLLSGIAALFLILPGYWVGFKVLLMPYTYALTNGAADTLKTTWSMTTGYYWQTVGLVFLEGLCLSLIGYAALFIALLCIGQVPLSIIVVAPLALALFVWLMHAHALVFVRWTFGLLPRSGVPSGIPVPV